LVSKWRNLLLTKALILKLNNLLILIQQFDAIKIHEMKVTAEKDEAIGKLIFGSIYPHYLNRIEKHGRTKKELNEVIEWLTGFDTKKLNSLIKSKATISEFYNAAEIHPNAHLIKGVICGYRIEDIEFPLYRKARYLDKLVDELAKGRKMEKIKRVEKVVK